MTFYREHKRVGFCSGDVIMTKQSHKAECDINNILAQYKRTGIITHVRNAQGRYEDLPDDVDFQSALEIVSSSTAAFERLPAVVRDAFGNDPGRFLASLGNPEYRARLVEWGVLKPAPKSDEAPPAASAPPRQAE